MRKIRIIYRRANVQSIFTKTRLHKAKFTHQTVRIQSFLRESCAFEAASHQALRSRLDVLSYRILCVRRIRSQHARRPTPSSARRG